MLREEEMKMLRRRAAGMMKGDRGCCKGKREGEEDSGKETDEGDAEREIDEDAN